MDPLTRPTFLASSSARTCEFFCFPFSCQSSSPQTSDDLKRAKQMSSAFSSMYHSILLGFCVCVTSLTFTSCVFLPSCTEMPLPQRTFSGVSVPCRYYINPKDTFVLEEIISKCGSQQCKDYTDEFNFKL